MVKMVAAPEGQRVINEALGINWSNWDAPSNLAYSQRDMPSFWPTAVIAPPERAVPLQYAKQPLDLEVLDISEPGSTRRLSAQQHLDRRMYNDALLVMHRGQVVHESYRNGMLETDLHVNHSTTKSLTTLLVGMAIDEGLVDPGAPVTDYLPEFRDLANWRKVSVQHALDMRTGLRYEEHYEDPDCICWSYFRATGYYPPKADTLPGYAAWIRAHMDQADCPPGERFVYSSPVTNALGLIAESVFDSTVAELLETRIFQRIGAESHAWLNLDPSGVAVTEGQLSLTLRDFARWASLFLYRGRNLSGEQVAPAAFIDDITVPRDELRAAWALGEYASIFPQGQYRNQTYVVNGPCTQIAMLGIHGQFCFADLERDLLMVGYGSYPVQVDQLLELSMQMFWDALCKCYPA